MVHLLSIQKHEKNVPYNCFALLIQLNIFKKVMKEGIFFYYYFNLFHKLKKKRTFVVKILLINILFETSKVRLNNRNTEVNLIERSSPE